MHAVIPRCIRIYNLALGARNAAMRVTSNNNVYGRGRDKAENVAFDVGRECAYCSFTRKAAEGVGQARRLK